MATHLVKLACELPDATGRSLSVWTCAELSRALKEAGVIKTISPQSVQRILCSYRLKPWRVHHWLSPGTPRDEAFRAKVLELCELYSRPLLPWERVLCLDEKTSLQPRTRTRATRPAQAGRPVLHGAKITDTELRDQATRAAKRTFLGLCEGLPHDGQALRRKYFVEANASLHEALGAVDLAATIEAMRQDDARDIQRLGVRLKRMLRGLSH